MPQIENDGAGGRGGEAAMPVSSAPRSLARRPSSGLLTIVAMLLFSGLFVGGLYYYAHRNAASRPEYVAATPGIPPQKLVVISCNLHWETPGTKLVEDFKARAADFVLLQQV